MSLPEEKYKALGRLGYSGAEAERTVQWLQAGGATSDILPQAWREFLDAGGYTAGIWNVDWYEFLGDQGHTGTLNEREIKYWQAIP